MGSLKILLRYGKATRIAVLCLAAIFAGDAVVVGSEAGRLPIVNGGFEDGPSVGWGRGQYSENRDWWWNSQDCLSVVEVSSQECHSGKRALYIINLSERSPHVYGTTQQPVAIEPGRRYRISLWAKSPQLASAGAVSIVVDVAWQVRPIQLPAGSFDWKQFAGEFTLEEDTAQLRILCEDMAEVWIDDIEITPVN